MSDSTPDAESSDAVAAMYDRAWLLALLGQKPGLSGFSGYPSNSLPLSREVEAIKGSLVDLEEAQQFAKHNLSGSEEDVVLNKCAAASAGSEELTTRLEKFSEFGSGSKEAHELLARFAKWIEVAADAIADAYSRAASAELRKLYHTAERDTERLISRIAANKEEDHVARAQLVKGLEQVLSVDKFTRNTARMFALITPRAHARTQAHAKQVFVTRQLVQAIVIKFGLGREIGATFYARAKEAKVAHSLVKQSDWQGEGHSRVSHRTAQRYDL